MIIIADFGAAYSSLYGQAVGLNIANHLGAIPMMPGIRDMAMPTSISVLEVSPGIVMSKYIRPLPTVPPNRPLSVLKEGCHAA